MDNGHSFDQVLFYGNEGLLFQFELLLFCVVVCLSGNFLLAIVVVGLTYKVRIVNYFECAFNNEPLFQLLKVLIATATKHNLASKTLIDKRFLM